MNEIKQQRNSPPKYIPPTINPANKPNKRDNRTERLSVPILVPSFPKSANHRQNDSRSLFITPLLLISRETSYKWKKKKKNHIFLFINGHIIVKIIQTMLDEMTCKWKATCIEKLVRIFKELKFRQIVPVKSRFKFSIRKCVNASRRNVLFLFQFSLLLSYLSVYDSVAQRAPVR